MDHNARRVLLCLRYGIGDVVMEIPVLNALRRALPRAHITAMGADPATQLLERHPAVNEVVALNRWGIRHRWDRGPASAAREIAAWLDDHDFDLFLDVHHVTPVFGQVVWSRGVRSLEADEAAERGEVARGGNGVAAIGAAVQAGWGLDVPRWAVPRIRPPRPEREFAADYLRRHGLAGALPTAVSPVASLTLKQWPLARLAGLADEMVEQTDRPILAFCGPQEGAGRALRSLMRNDERVVCVGPIHLLRVAALLERCSAFVCNDTGLMHMAGAVGVPTVAIFGPTAPDLYCPPGDWVIGVGGEAIDCPHRNTASLHPPACFAEGLTSLDGCIRHTSETDVHRALRRVLSEAAAQPQPTPSVA
jgi:ADP-heptose:LPS heptosyltransferase